MHDMFIHSQQLVTSSGAVQPKKRKTENSFSEQCILQNNNHHHTTANATTIAVNNSSQTEFSHASPRNQQQPFVRASTIKLLDTYQRCGQKVIITI